eukprot:3933769-Rhodomonas_salina.1
MIRGSDSLALLSTSSFATETDTSGDSGDTPWISGAPACADICRLHASETPPSTSAASVEGRWKLVLRETSVSLSVETSITSAAPDSTSRRLTQMWCTDELVSIVFPASPSSSDFASLAPIP